MAPAISIRAEVRIKAPAAEVWANLIDTSTWPDWNSFVPQAEIIDTPSEASPLLSHGCRCRLNAMINGTKRPSTQKITVFDVPEEGSLGPLIYRITWVLDDVFPNAVLRTERFNELEEVAGENGPECIYRTGEDQSSPMAYVVKMFFGKASRLGLMS